MSPLRRLVVSLFTGSIALVLPIGPDASATRAVAAWDAFAICLLVLAWRSMLISDVKQCRRTSTLQDTGRTFASLFVVFASIASLFAVTLQLDAAKGMSTRDLVLHLVLSAAAVVASWALIHTFFTFIYAHLYYGNRGLAFPGEDEPGYSDFAYFSFVIGMTFQVSDVQITSSGMRRMVLLHGLVSFAFNMVILALSVNVVSGLI